MADVNERSFRGEASTDAVIGAAAQHHATDTATSWSLRSPLRAPAVVRILGTRIVKALRPSAAKSETPSQPDALQSAAIELARHSIGDSDSAAADFVAVRRAAGMSADDALLNLLAPAARHLGDLWASDEADFAFVTLGMNRLHRILRDIADDFAPMTGTAPATSVLLTVIPGEQHSFGLAVVAEFFRRAGWDLCLGPFETHRELISLVGNHWFDVVGFSVSSDRRLDELRTDISNIRRSSRNKSVVILVGGPMVQLHPELLAGIGADAMSADGLTAPQQARSLIAQTGSRH